MRLQSLILSCASAVAALALGSAEPRAATLNIVNGELVGASAVSVNGSLYDVTFVEGSCIGLLSTDCGSDLPLGPAATAAAQALLDQVFRDGPSGPFDSVPSLTFGCSADQSCSVWIPTVSNLIMMPGAPPGSITLGLVIAVNSVSFDLVFSLLNADPSEDTAVDPSAVFSTWTLVPEPSSCMLVGAGLVFLAASGVAPGSRRR